MGSSQDRQSAPSWWRRRAAAAALVALLLMPLPMAGGGAVPLPMTVAGVSLSVAPSGISFSSGYVLAGDLVSVNVTVSNDGDTGATGTLDLLVGTDPPVVFATVGFVVAPNASTMAAAVLNTSSLVGIETITARITGSTPGESGPLTDDEASTTLRVHHAIVDQLWQGSQAGIIDTTYPHTGFVTIRDTASLTIGPTGRLVFEQLHDNQFDILVEGNGVLRVSGGVVFSNFSLSVELTDSASLVVESGATFNASVRSTSVGPIEVNQSSVNSVRFEADGGTLLLSNARLAAEHISLSNVVLAASNSTLWAGEPVAVGGASSSLWRDSEVNVESRFESTPSAEVAFPGIGSYLSAGAGPFQPAIRLSGSSTAEFHATSASSRVWVGSQSVSSTVPLFAEGASTGTLYRTAHVQVTDPTGAPVPNATVEVRHRINSSLIASAMATSGVADIELPSTLLLSGAALMVGQYKVVAWRAATTSDEVPFNFPLYPEISRPSLTQFVPVALALKVPWGLYSEDPLYINATPAWSTNVVLNRSIEVSAPLLLGGQNVTLLQSRPFERYILIADSGWLGAQGSVIRSDYPFNLYILNGSKARLENSAILGGNLLLTGAGNITLTDSRIVGSVIGDADHLDCSGSFVWSRLFDLNASAVTASDCVFAGSELVALGATGAAALSSVGFGTTFEPFDAGNRTALPYSQFEAAAEGAAAATGAPSVRLGADALSATSLTVWTAGVLSVSLGSGDSTMGALRVWAAGTAFDQSGGNVTVEQSSFPPGAPLSFAGAGRAVLRGVSSGAPAAAPAVTLDIFEPVVVTVFDALGLPAPSATVTAEPQSQGPPREAVPTDALGHAQLLLLVSHTQSGATERGPLYRINATRASSVSPTVTWDSTQATVLTLTLDGIFGAVRGDGSFALVTHLGSGQWRVLATNLPTPSLPVFIESFGVDLGALNTTAPVYPGENATLYVAADYVFTQGSESAALPIAGESGSVKIAGATVGSFAMTPDGLAVASVALPSAAGLADVVVSLTAPRLSGPLEMSGSFSITPRPKLVIEASLAKRTFKPAEQLTVVGVVRDDAGKPIAGATVVLEGGVGVPGRVAKTAADGSFLLRMLAPQALGDHNIRLTATLNGSLDSDAVSFPYSVSTTTVAPPAVRGPALNPLSVIAFVGAAAVGTGALLFVWTQRRVARGEFVVCGRCEKPTYVTDKKCRNCGVEFEATVAKCSKCGSWISPDAASCPQCKTTFSRERVRGEEEDSGPTLPEPSIGVPAGFDIPESIPAQTRRTEGARLEDMEFKLPGTTDTLELGEKGGAPTFASSGAARGPPSTGTGADRPLERMDLPRHDEADSPVREVSVLEGGQPTRREPVSLGTANVDLSRTTAAATSTKPDPPAEEEIPEDVLRELLMKAAPELGGDVLPGEIRKELQEIARSEAPVTSEKKAASLSRSERPATPVAPDERAAEAPEKSRKTAFDVFSKPAKNIPTGYEKKGGAGAKDASGKAAPVCPNCGGNWVVQRDGKNSCRVCGTRW